MKAAVCLSQQALVIEAVQACPNPGPRELLIRTGGRRPLPLRPAIHGKGSIRILCPPCSVMNREVWSRRSAPTSPM